MQPETSANVAHWCAERVDTMKMKSKFLFAVAVLGVALVATSVARANTVTIALQEAGVNAGALTTVASGAGAAAFVGTYGTFTLDSTTGTGSPFLPLPELDSGTVNASSSTAGTLTVEITETGLTAPFGPSTLLSSFTSNTLAGAITSVSEKTYADASGAAFGTGILLDSTTFTSIGTAASVDGVNFSAPFSETEVFVITASGIGDTSDTIQISSAPEPATLSLVGFGLLGLFGLRKKQ